MSRTVSLGLSLLLAALPALAEAPLVEARLLTGWREAGGNRMVGVRIDLQPGWKTYWRAPGEAGIPPMFDWTRSENVAEVRVHWPVPHVFDQSGMRTVGYDGGVVWPMEIVPRDPSRPVDLRATVTMGVCRDICVPVEVELQERLQGNGAPDAAIRAALADAPERSGRASCAVAPIADGLRVTATLAVPPAGAAEMVVFEPGEPGIWVSDAELSRQGGQLVATADLVPPEGQPFALDRSALRLTVLGEDRMFEIAGCPSP